VRDQGGRQRFQTLLANAVVPLKGAPNVLLIKTDDRGYGVSGTFGGVIPTPSMDRIAARREASAMRSIQSLLRISFVCFILCSFLHSRCREAFS
jgi:hypothetical protein